MPNPVIIIVGAGPGIGAATARRFAAAGYDIGLLARDADRLQAFAAELEKGGTKVGWAAVDIADPTALDATLRRMTDHTGRVDVLVHNAVAFRAVPATELTSEQLLADLGVGVASLLTAVQAVLPVLREQHTGTIIATGSGAADHPSTSAASLGVQKAALRNLIQALAAELSGEGIHVATVTVRGRVAEGTPFSPEAIAGVFAGLVAETGTAPANWHTLLNLTEDGVTQLTQDSVLQ
jgi:NADP-dependent 3-hydroxy acid dehydrogenase YdfG